MNKYVWAILTNAEPGTEDEFNRWYNEVHAPDVMRVPGVIGVQRFHLAGMQSKPGPEGIKVVPTGETDLRYKYLALYTIETDDLTGVLQTVADRAGTTEMPMSETLNSDIGTMAFELIMSDSKR